MVDHLADAVSLDDRGVLVGRHDGRVPVLADVRRDGDVRGRVAVLECVTQALADPVGEVHGHGPIVVVVVEVEVVDVEVVDVDGAVVVVDVVAVPTVLVVADDDDASVVAGSDELASL